ncbi:insulinase family protein [Parabacteroides merdae]|jgi:predicted Zn-dependent peptidase|uniref:Insulinase family protein n=2 Tax=Parabacteroides merdae TaxID=46503 RepID=A0A9Q4REQ3_9BACT|nr:insulinase family protein [Parabacteroides merdae]MRX88657.1 insulinase family protein [Parabacteroides merdae]MTT09856.1 insulinase family protein [Parabacteroides merdae]MTT13869.1 insulinase family protein [Parabacteroides merdae]MTT42875.1 insulinase family protein [Parabacteroides merdae]
MMVFACCSYQSQAEDLNALKVKEYRLENGLTVWLNEDHSQPKVFGAVVVKAGAKDCPDTGIAHYFEHMMFKGTDRIGTLDYESEKVLLDSIAMKYDELAMTEDTAARARLQKEINELSIRSSEYVIPNEFNRLINRFGGSGLNAATSYDATIYFNTFSPQYMVQWAEINSERLINPVFRLFQSELETVYEEKNMYGDFIGGQVMDTLMARYFGPHPYAYPIIGSTKNLKNPRLTEMHKFFEDYYVASNMALILSGDFDAQQVMPILEKAFSRIRSGNAPKQEKVMLPPFNGRETMKVKFPIPFIKAMGLGFRGVSANHEDQVALNIAVNLLNNANGTGYLDKLMVEHKLMGALAINESMNEAGILAVAIMPKLLIQSYSSAEKMVWDEINRVKNGDFSDEMFNSLKLEQKRQYASSLENIDSRATIMMNLFSQGKSWNDYLNEVARIESITKEDVVRVAQKYFSNNYLCVTKSTGKYPKDNLPKPAFSPVVPRNADASSSYAKQLEKIPEQQVAPRIIDFEKDVKTSKLTPLVTLYTTPNPLNDIFTLNISYGIGALEQPELMQLTNYLQLLGTESLSFEQFRSRLQSIGSTLAFDVTPDAFVMKVTGFDNHIDETMELVGDFIRHAKADDKKLRQIVDDAKVSEKAFFKSGDNVASALLEQVKYGDQSRYLRKLSLSQIKKLKGKDMLAIYDKVRSVQCDLHYCGTLPVEKVIGTIRQHLPLERTTIASNSPYYRELKQYDRPTVFFIDMPDMAQSIVYGYVKGDPVDDKASRHASRLFSVYFGGDMSSLMFQEIREFRSFAYRTSGRYQLPNHAHKGTAGSFTAMLSTQSDKTLDALGVLDSLIREMPLKPERVEAVKQTLVNRINNDYPPFRNLSEKVASARMEGFDRDPAEEFLRDIATMDMQDISRFYREQISGRPVVYVIAGNRKHIDMKKLAEYGTIIKVKKKDIYK